MDAFERLSVAFLNELLDAFPQSTNVELSDIETDASDEAVANFAGTVEFLHNSGFIELGSLSAFGTMAMNTRLTMKGLAVMKRVPDVLVEKGTLGDRIARAAKGGGAEAAKAVIGQLVSVAAEMMKNG